MTGVLDAGSTRVLLAGPAVARTFMFALAGRLAYGVLPLCFLFTIRDASGSFAIAATSSGTLGLGTLAMPVQARLVDRLGQRLVLPAYAACYVALLILCAAFATTLDVHPAWAALGPLLGLLLGMSGPALGPSMRAQWREVAPDGPLRRRAYSLDSVGEESLYLVGPLVAGGVLAMGLAWVGLLVAAALVACGTAALVGSPYLPDTVRAGATSDEDAEHRSLRGPLRRPPLLVVLGTLALFGAGGAAAFVGVAALADRTGEPGAAGLVEAAMAVAALVGGLSWSRWGVPPGRRAFTALLGFLAATQLVAAAAAPHLSLAGAALAIGAVVTSPVFALAFSTADLLVPAEEQTEASTWVTVAANLGTAAGTALAGSTTALGGAVPFLLAAALTAGGALLASAAVGRPAP
jgi:MFS family permease